MKTRCQKVFQANEGLEQTPAPLVESGLRGKGFTLLELLVVIAKVVSRLSRPAIFRLEKRGKAAVLSHAVRGRPNRKAGLSLRISAFGLLSGFRAARGCRPSINKPPRAASSAVGAKPSPTFSPAAFRREQRVPTRSWLISRRSTIWSSARNCRAGSPAL
jgi:hypothetical protein